MMRATSAAGFDFARRLRHSDFRTYLKSLGWESGQPMLMAEADEPSDQIVVRARLHEITGTAWAAVPDIEAPHGFRVTRITVPA